jgi:hypothetical protein
MKHTIWAPDGHTFFDKFPRQNGLKEEDAILPLFLNRASEYAIWNMPEFESGD